MENDRCLSDSQSSFLVFSQSDVVALEEPFFTDTSDGFVIYPLGGKDPGQPFVNEKIGVLPSEVNKLFSIDLKTTADKWIIRQPVTFQNKTYFNVAPLTNLLWMLPAMYCTRKKASMVTVLPT